MNKLILLIDYIEYLFKQTDSWEGEEGLNVCNIIRAELKLEKSNLDEEDMLDKIRELLK